MDFYEIFWADIIWDLDKSIQSSAPTHPHTGLPAYGVIVYPV